MQCFKMYSFSRLYNTNRAFFKKTTLPVKMEPISGSESSSDDSSTSGDSSSSTSVGTAKAKNENQGKSTNVKRQPLFPQDKLLSLQKALM